MNRDFNIEKGEHQLFYVGTYTGDGSEGIYTCQLDMSSGALRMIGLAGNVQNPSYLAIDAKRHRLYAVNELVRFGEQLGGSVSAFAIQRSSGDLSPINQRHSHGGAPCYLTLDHTGRYLFLVNYLGGNVVVLPINEHGALGEPTGITTHSGSSLHPERQDGPHPHAIIVDSANDYAFVPDLGLDKVMQYRFDRKNGRLQANEKPWVATKPGSGPRHMVFHHNMRLAYVVNELSSTLTAYSYDSGRGTLTPFQTISTVPEGYGGVNIAADIHLSPNAKFLFCSNRGHDSIASYAVDRATGRLTPIDCAASQGRKPRGFAVDPGGTFLLVANQDSNTIVTLRIDDDQGFIIPTGHSLPISNPTCLKFLSPN